MFALAATYHWGWDVDALAAVLPARLYDEWLAFRALEEDAHDDAVATAREGH